MIVFEVTDKVKVEVDSLVFEVSPLSFLIKSKIQTQVVQGDALGAAVTALKAGIKSVKGLKRKDGSDYVLSFDGDMVSDKSIDDLMNIPHSQKLIAICMNLISGMPEKQFVDQNGKPLDGVKFAEGDSEKK
jgi:hypothetical protein